MRHLRRCPIRLTMNQKTFGAALNTVHAIPPRIGMPTNLLDPATLLLEMLDMVNLPSHPLRHRSVAPLHREPRSEACLRRVLIIVENFPVPFGRKVASPQRGPARSQIQQPLTAKQAV